MSTPVYSRIPRVRFWLSEHDRTERSRNKICESRNNKLDILFKKELQIRRIFDDIVRLSNCLTIEFLKKKAEII